MVAGGFKNVRHLRFSLTSISRGHNFVAWDGVRVVRVVGWGGWEGECAKLNNLVPRANCGQIAPSQIAPSKKLEVTR